MSIPSNAKTRRSGGKQAQLSPLLAFPALRSRLFRAKGLTRECTLRFPPPAAAVLIFVGQALQRFQFMTDNLSRLGRRFCLP